MDSGTAQVVAALIAAAAAIIVAVFTLRARRQRMQLNPGSVLLYLRTFQLDRDHIGFAGRPLMSIPKGMTTNDLTSGRFVNTTLGLGLEEDTPRSIYHVESNTKLKKDLTLSRAGIKDGDTLILVFGHGDFPLSEIVSMYKKLPLEVRVGPEQADAAGPH